MGLHQLFVGNARGLLDHNTHQSKIQNTHAGAADGANDDFIGEGADAHQAQQKKGRNLDSGADTAANGDPANLFTGSALQNHRKGLLNDYS